MWPPDLSLACCFKPRYELAGPSAQYRSTNVAIRPSRSEMRVSCQALAGRLPWLPANVKSQGLFACNKRSAARHFAMQSTSRFDELHRCWKVPRRLTRDDMVRSAGPKCQEPDEKAQVSRPNHLSFLRQDCPHTAQANSSCYGSWWLPIPATKTCHGGKGC